MVFTYRIAPHKMCMWLGKTFKLTKMPVPCQQVSQTASASLPFDHLELGCLHRLLCLTQEMNMPYGDDEILPWTLASRRLPLELPFSQLQLKKCWNCCYSENTQVLKLRSGSWVRMTTAEPGDLCASCVPQAIDLLLDLGSDQTFLQPLIKSSRSSVLAPESESACWSVPPPSMHWHHSAFSKTASTIIPDVCASYRGECNA